jgi:hypothetical protein
MTRYYDLWDDMRLPGRWHLKSPVDEQGNEVEPWQFKAGKYLELERTPIFCLARPGDELDFTLTGLTIPLVHRRVTSLFERLGLQQEVQFLPARVEGQSNSYFILNVLQTIRCIDDARCEEVLYWLPEDNRPDKVGQYRNVAGLRIDPAKVGRAQVFRTWGWRGPIIVSERVKSAMKDEGITGPEFIEV